MFSQSIQDEIIRKQSTLVTFPFTLKKAVQPVVAVNKNIAPISCVPNSKFEVSSGSTIISNTPQANDGCLVRKICEKPINAIDRVGNELSNSGKSQPTKYIQLTSSNGIVPA